MIEPKILVKEIDRFKSQVIKGKIISEFIVYTMVDDVPISAYAMYNTIEYINKRYGANQIFLLQ